MSQLSFNSLDPRNSNRMFGWVGENVLAKNLLSTQLNYVDWTLSSTQMDTLNATPVTLLAAPGSGLMNIVEGIVTFVDAGSTPFELGTGTLGFLYTDGSGDAVATAVPNATVESASDVYYYSVPLAVAPLANALICAKASADVTAGNGTLYGRIFYKTIVVADFLL